MARAEDGPDQQGPHGIGDPAEGSRGAPGPPFLRVDEDFTLATSEDDSNDALPALMDQLSRTGAKVTVIPRAESELDEFLNTSPADLARAKATIKSLYARLNGRLNSGQERTLAGTRRRDTAESANEAPGVMYLDELSPADIRAAESGLTPELESQVALIQGYENDKIHGDLRIMNEDIDGETVYFVAEVFYGADGQVKSSSDREQFNALANHTDVQDLRRVIANLQGALDKPVLRITADEGAE